MKTRIISKYAEAFRRPLQGLRITLEQNWHVLENVPNEIQQLVNEANKKLRDCPFCGNTCASIEYEFVLEYHGHAMPAYMFSIKCRCGSQTMTYPAMSDNVDDIKITIEHIVGCWNRRPGDPWVMERQVWQ